MVAPPEVEVKVRRLVEALGEELKKFFSVHSWKIANHELNCKWRERERERERKRERERESESERG